ncbi:unnamed protein product [Mytilus edulis]|uniref:Uncharacterized protein n=1 Tax=Mytilus edulis TaxID=6550 RepID=A0A8S3S0I9_MYTED|nr:unnamed protein product [Mytilus edulis]
MHFKCIVKEAPDDNRPMCDAGAEQGDNGHDINMHEDNDMDIDVNDTNTKVIDAHYILRLRADYHLSQSAVKRDALGYLIPFKKQLEQLLSMKEVQECLQEDVRVTNKMTDFYDGRYMSKAFYQNHPDALLFALYYDDFEIANPIGAHRKKHKLSIFYWSLLNISPEFRFKVQTVQLIGVAKTSYIKKFGSNVILSDFVDGMKKLYTGCDILVGSELRKLFGTLYCVLGIPQQHSIWVALKKVLVLQKSLVEPVK